MIHPLTPREKAVFKQPCEHCQRMTTVDLTALASGSGDHAELARLAEADRLINRAADLMRQCTDPDRFEGASTLNVYANMRAWLSDLSKGAERG